MFENKRIFILGMARSGYYAAKVLSRFNNYIVLSDINTNEDEDKVNELKILGVKVVLGPQEASMLDEGFDYIIKNPGVKFDNPLIVRASELGIKVINEQEMAYHLLPKGVKIIGITGTNGKTTTTTLTYEIMKAYYGDRVHLCGNIGFPFCEVLDSIKENDYVVMEIGVPQLHDFYDFNADVAVLTNLYEAHLDMFKTREYYNENKKRIFMNHTSNNVAILNAGNSDVMDLTSDIKSTKKYFSSKVVADCYLENGKIYYLGKEVVDTKDILLKGEHNYENIMCAIMCCNEMNVPFDVMKDVICGFRGVSHRIEYVDCINGVTYYNDSKATNITSTQIALSAFDKPTILLLGGLERNQNFLELKDYMSNVKLVICFGQCKDRAYDSVTSLNKDAIVVSNLSEAVDIAIKKSSAGDVVLLSPASASWDQYKCFEDRGNEFKMLVNNSKEANKLII